ncbi:NAD(P)H-hydrate dehydratase [Lysobacter sp. N42]|uniref:NAD(P)H-hydrate dehydratase n=1 Tax=Lysobacter sp. N42 TaxID=2545719 RepID=UPI00104F65FE|nr:NAD(P)H-hydrate dehydratase [Lysobacter sp. N42]TCZ88629.1 NAD(P)H-hydrate dehydratase [Lysobacter sp. N42]
MRTRRAGPVALTPAWLRRHPLPQPDDTADKRGRGQVLVVAGAGEMPGAALLCAVGTLRAGAGRLQVATTAAAAPLVAATVPEARVIALPEAKSGALSTRARARLDALAADADALVVGPGMLEADAASRMLAGWLAGLPAIPAVVDAAALCALGLDGERIAAGRAELILTPHAGEAARLLAVEREVVEADACAHCRELASRYGAVVVMKGATTYIAAGTGPVLRNRHGNVGLAMSGSGDTLAGIIGGLSARGAGPSLAAAWGVFLHAAAADAIRARQGTLGFLARELLDEIPSIMNAFASGRSQQQRPRPRA